MEHDWDDWMDCDACEGTGIDEDGEDCYVCDGHGEVQNEEE